MIKPPFKYGEKYLCLYNQCRDLTYGKVYQCIKTCSNILWVQDDIGHKRWNTGGNIFEYWEKVENNTTTPTSSSTIDSIDILDLLDGNNDTTNNITIIKKKIDNIYKELDEIRKLLLEK